MTESRAVPPTWTTHRVGYPSSASIPALFAESVAATPEKMAVLLPAGDRKVVGLTYADLDRRSTALARELIELGVRPGGTVGLLMQRSLETIVAMLATLKARAAYVPLDPAYPTERLRFMLEDVKPDVVLTSPHCVDRLPPFPGRALTLEPGWGQNGTTTETSLPPGTATDAAYVIYTSGSTGRPKGVVVPHRGITRLVRGTNFTTLTAETTFLQLAPISFDASTLEIWGPLLNGGTCVLFPTSGVPDFDQLGRVIRECGVTHLWLTASLFNLIVDSRPLALSNIRELLTGGEALSVPHIRKALERLPDTTLVNGYGPTESTTFACCYRIPRDLPVDLVSIPIGTPIGNTGVYVLDENSREVPIGTPGELHIGGDGLALGYFQRDELTAERFIPNPLTPEFSSRLYRTGDRVRWLPDGIIEFLGRVDDQVKIRGYRIELGEVAAVAATHDDVRDAVAIVREDTPGDKRLVLYITGPTSIAPNVASLRRHFESRAPEFMIPSAFVVVDSIPLTANGKADKAALPAPGRARPDLGLPLVHARSELELLLTQMWRDILGLDEVGVHDRFFDLGGTSLWAAEFIRRLSAALSQDIPLVALFDAPTVAEIAQVLVEDYPSAVSARFNLDAQRIESNKAALRSSRRNAGPSTRTEDDTIAVIGMAGRFPKAKDIHAFWDNLERGVEGTVNVTADDLRRAGRDPKVLEQPDYVAATFALDDAECFDATFFGMTPREAEITDPQIRLMLETAWSALEHAGYDPSRYTGRIGVFGGVGRNSYLHNQLAPHRHFGDSLGEYHMLVGNERDFPTTHVSYRLNLRGPSVDVQSACSTSGVAIHLACQSLRARDSDMALVGGCKVICPNREGYWYVEGGPLAPEPHIRAFSEDANGMVRGSGAALLVLKRLSDALADGDTIYGLIKGSAINNDGSNKVGFTAPSARGQADVIAAALAAAGLSADDISYVETHGTGTKLGDPIEVAGLTRAFRETTSRTQFCAIGSVKTNIGHLDAGATAAGVIKTLLAFTHEKLPKSLNFTAPNPAIDFANSPFFVNSELRAWPKADTPRRAGVSSFGLGGTNAHVVLEEAPALPGTTASRAEQLLVWSGRTADAVDLVGRRLGEFLGRDRGLDLADVAHTLQIGRKSLPHRQALVSATASDAATSLKAGDKRHIVTGPEVKAPTKVAFLFAGGGAQYANMGRGLYDREPVFRTELDRAADVLRPILGLDIRTVIFVEADADEASRRMERPSLALPALFSVQYATAKLWASWGVRPSAMIGHSMGEYTAACLAGVMTLEDALALVSCRGRLFEKLPEGAMLSIPLGEHDAGQYLTPDLAFAAVNRPNQCVASGPVAAIEALQAALSAKDVDSTRVHIRVAAHSPMVEPILEEFREFLRTIPLSEPVLPFVSNLSGSFIEPREAADPEYWVRHLRSTVRFSEGVKTLLGGQDLALLEVGPGQTLATLVRQHSSRSASTAVVSSLRHPQEVTSDTLFLTNALGKLWVAGVDVDWDAYRGQERRRRVGLPTYPFERKRHWVDAPARVEESATPAKTNGVSTAPVDAPAQAPSPTAIAPSPSAVVPLPAGPSLAPTPSANRKDRLVQELQRVISDLSGMSQEEVDPNLTFLELGFDSLFLTQANAQFKKVFGIKLTVRQLLEKTPRVGALAEFLDGELPPEAFREEAAAPAVAAAPLATGGATAAPGSLDAIMQTLAAVQAQVALLAGAKMPAPLAKAAPAPVPAPAAATAAAPSPVAAGTDKTSPWQPVQKGERASDGFNDKQREHLASLMARVIERTHQSKHLTQQHRSHLSDPRTVQGFRKVWKEIVYPIVSDRAQGSRIWDVDGNEYIDLVNGYGVTFFGHTPDFIIKAVEAQLRKTVAIGPQTPLAGEVANLVCEITGAERAAFCNTGSEAVLAAVRMARTVTGRRRLATFSGHYHGIFDEVLVKGITVRGKRKSMPISPGIRADVVEDVIVMDYGDPESFARVREHAHEIALVMVEPIRSRNPARQPVEFLRELRRLTAELDIPLLMDEMVTGFRSHPGGIQALWNIRADLVTYGKVVGGGFPIGVVAGSRKYMDALDGGAWSFGDDSQPEADMTWFAGTFVRHPPALAAAKAVLERLKQAGPALQEQLADRVKRFADDLNEHFRITGSPLFLEYFSSFFVIKFEPYQEFSNLLFYHLHNRGIYTYEGRPAFITTEHSEADMKLISDALKDAVAEMQRGGFFPGRPLQGEEEVLEIPLSDGQQEIWLATRFGTDASMAFNLASTLAIRGALSVEHLRHALDALGARHEALRTIPNDDGTSQRVLHASKLRIPLTVLDLRAENPSERNARVERVRSGEVETPFDLDRGPLVRAVLIQLADEEYSFILTAHHIVADGWSCGVLLRDLGKLYATAEGNRVELTAPMQLSEWVQREIDERGSEERTAALEYWLGQFREPAPVLDLPTDRPRPPVKTYKARRQNLDLDEDFTRQIRQLATKLGATTFATLLAAFQSLVHRLSGQADVVIGFSLAGQSNLQGKDLVGHCVNFLPLRMSVAGDSSFAEQVAQARGKVFDAVENQKFTFGNLLQKLNMRRDPSRVPLMSVAFNLDPSGKGIAFGTLAVTPGSVPRRYENFDLFFNVVELTDRLQIQCTFNEDLWDGETVARHLRQYRKLLESALAEPATSIDKLPILPADELHTLLTAWNPPFASSAPQGSIHDRVREMAERYPESVAVRCGDESLKYRELEARANQLAHHLRSKGVRTEDLVAVCAERSTRLVVAILAVLKAGAAYVPLDPANPSERLAFVLTDSKARVVVSEGNLLDDTELGGAELFLLDRDAGAIDGQPSSPPDVKVQPTSVAYVIYTSGSTGKPKGVMVEHRQVLRLLDATDGWFHFGPGDVWTLFHSFAFDFSVWEIWGALMQGGRLVVVPYLVSRSPDEFLALLEREQVTVLNQTPSAFRQLMAADEAEADRRQLGLRYVIFGGEALDIPSLGPWFERRGDQKPQLVNMYGITETTVHVTYRPITAADVFAKSGSLIGRPIPDLQIYIVDAALQPVPIGVTGEILVGGAGVARGYLNQPELTKQRFIDHPFGGTGKLYRSGDLARFLPTRDIEYLGRADNQVKIRGFRIELGEIESAISEHPSVRQASVLLRRDAVGQPLLVAYCVPQTEAQGTNGGIPGREVHKGDWLGKWDLLYRSGRESLERAGAGDRHLNDEAILDQLSDQESFREEWLEFQGQTLDRILARPLGDALEIGCGTGQILLAAAPHAKTYIGTDFAELGIAEVERQVAKQNITNVRAAVCEANDFAGVEPRSLDTVIINSVAQYFPDADYLVSVLAGAVERLRSGGCIYIGDVQSRAFLYTHHANDQLGRVAPGSSIDTLRGVVDGRVVNEDELVVDPEFFHAFRARHPRVSRIELKLRRGKILNETTRYHYDVWLFVDAEPAPLVAFEPWRPDMTAEELAERLANERPERLCFQGVPNGRITREVVAASLVRKAGGPATPAELLAAAERDAPRGIDPEALWALSEKLPYRVDVLWTPGDRAHFDLVVTSRDIPEHAPLPARAGQPDVGGAPARFANSPYLKGLAKTLTQDLKSFASTRLPDYMVPSHWFLLDALPLTPNGKVDVRALPMPGQTESAHGVEHVAPSSQTEHVVAGVWTEVLRLPKLGVNDNFFELGGHSLLAVQVIMRLRQELNVEIALGSIFSAPTVATLSQTIDAHQYLQGKAVATPEGETEALVF